ncbi:MAG: hypothetical protein V1894_04110, partial [Chloroflexota bacterium]
DSYQVIQPYERFKELINKRGLVLLQEKEPRYCQRFQTCETLRLEPSQTLRECNPLLSSKFNRFVDFLESMYEVGYYWKRLTETARLLEVNVPETPLQQMNEASWFIYNLDFYWHTVYGMEERIIKFLTILKRMYKSPSPEEAELLKKYIEVFKMVKTEATKIVRDPLAHFRSQGVQGWRNDHQWEAALLRSDNSDFIEIYDKNYLHHKDFYLGYIRMWVPQYGETLSIMFDRLSTFSLERLELE